jgi:hypothetical protein
MSNKITVAASQAGRAIIMQGDKVWNGTAMVTFTDANPATYLLTPTRIGTASKLWMYTIPATLPSDDYDLLVYGSTTPVVTDTPVQSAGFYWDGTNAWLPRASLSAQDVTLTIKDGYGNPSVGTEVWITRSTDINDVIAGQFITDEDGEVRVPLVPGTYYRWAQKDGEAFTNPQAFSVSMN